MNIGLKFRDLFSGRLGQAILNELDNLLSGIIAHWEVEHKEEGKHGDVTADSLDVAGDVTVDGRVTATAFYGPGIGVSDIPETSIADGSLLARVGSNETVTGTWAFSTLPTLASLSGWLKGTSGAVTASSTIPEADIADGTVFPRLAASETITGDNWTFKAVSVGRVQVLSASGTYNDWAPTGAAGCSFFDVVPAAASNVTITGLSFSQADGRVVFLFNNQGYGGGTITIKHEDANSTAANRCYTPGSVDYVLNSGYGAVLIYNGARWLIVGSA